MASECGIWYNYGKEIAESEALLITALRHGTTLTSAKEVQMTHPQCNCLICGKQFTRYRTTGAPQIYCSAACRHRAFNPLRRKPIAERFWVRVEKTPTCWLWRGATNSSGYGVMQKDGRRIRAHRFAYELTYGAIPEGLFACHRCDNPLCVRPDHLFLGTPADNAHDMIRKGRHVWFPVDKPAPPRSARGEQHGRAKLTAEQVAEIRRIHASERLSHQKLAERYGINKSTAGRIVRGQLWAGYEDAEAIHQQRGGRRQQLVGMRCGTGRAAGTGG